MATTRVKRTGSKKRKSQRLHGRKTKRQHKRNHNNRMTRRQRGGRDIVRKSGSFFFPTGIDITYDDNTRLYKIGSTHYSKVTDFKDKRYERAANVLKDMRKSDLNLTSREFCTFSEKYCQQDSSDPQCAAIREEALRARSNADLDDEVQKRLNSKFKKASAGLATGAFAASASEPVKLEILLKPEGIQFGDQLFKWPLSTRNVESLEISNRMIQSVSFKNKMIKEALKVSIDKIVFFKRITDTPGGTSAGTTFVSIYFLKREQAMCALKNYREAIENPSFSIQELSDDFSPTGTPPNQLHVATILLTDLNDTDFTNQIDRFFGTWYEFYNGERCKSEPSSLARQVDTLSLSP